MAALDRARRRLFDFVRNIASIKRPVHYSSVRRFRSGAGVLGSTPGLMAASFASTVLVSLRLVSLMLQLKVPSEVHVNKNRKEAAMESLRAVAGAIAETVWALGVAVGAGLLLPS